METIEVVYEYGSFTHPLTVEFAPECLAPAGIRDREMKSVRISILPVTCSYIVTERILVAVQDKLRISGCSGTEEDEHRISAAGSFGCALEMCAVCRKLCVEIVPALTLTVHNYLGLQSW